MKPMFAVPIVLLLAIAGGALLYHLRHRESGRGPLYHARTEFEFTIHAPYAFAAPLFGADRERVWASDNWNPKFLYPQPGRDIEGSVFLVSHGHRHATWVNTVFDLQQGHVQYVYFIPDAMVTLIDIHLSRANAATTKVSVAYERTALRASANEHVRELGDADRNSGKTWGDDIERYLSAHARK